jgi:hypothetical protein
LFLSPISSKSHKNVFDPLIDALASRGHELTVVSSLKSSKHPSVKEIVPVTTNEMMSAVHNGFEIRKLGTLNMLKLFSNTTMMDLVCHKFYQHPDIQPILKRQQSFDLVIMNGLANACVLGIVGHLGVPVIYVTTLPPPSALVQKLGTSGLIQFSSNVK